MIIAIDTETGGVEPGKSALLSISACYYDEPLNTFNAYISPDPSLEINEEAAGVNGYTPELWQKRGAIPLREALYRFKNWMPRSGNSPLAHNAPFDKSFLDAAEKQTGFNTYLQRRWRCSMGSFMFANDVLNLNPVDFKLETLAKMSGHWQEGFVRGAHQSIDDVTACAAGYKWLRGLFQKKMNLDMEATFAEKALRFQDQISTLKQETSGLQASTMAAVELLTDLRWAQNFTISREETKRQVETDIAAKNEKLKRFV